MRDRLRGTTVASKRRSGRVLEHIDVSGTLEITGTLEAGATVRSGARLTVTGPARGPLIVEPDGGVLVRGPLSGAIHDRGGMVLISGVFAAEVVEDQGGIGVEVDSVVIADSRTYLVTADGLNEVTEHIAEHHASGGNGSYLMRQPDGSFAPAP